MAIRSAPAVWLSLSSWLPPRTADLDYWWKLTGRHLATMLEAGGYTTESQYEALLFHYHWIVGTCFGDAKCHQRLLFSQIFRFSPRGQVPALGAPPSHSGKLNWPSLLGVEGSPIEYSWKWNTLTSKPDVRFTMEAIDRFSGTARDPLNQDASRQLLLSIAESFSTVDLTWVNHFLATLYDHDRCKYAREAANGSHFSTTIMTAIEYLPKGLNTKTYFIPRRLGQDGGQIPLSHWDESLDALDPGNAARAALNDFLANDEEGKLLSPFMLAVDNVIPAKSRLKFYFQTPHTSFKSIRRIMTLGGRIKVPESNFADLKSLINAVTGLPDDFPEDKEAPLGHDSSYNPAAKENFVELPILLAGYLYYFDIAPGASLPNIKFYSPVRRYGPDDLALAHGITKWMTEHGRGEYCDRYMNMLRNLCEHRHLQDGKGIQTYVSCLFKPNGELDITSYIGPEAFDAKRLTNGVNGSSPRRGTRRRSDSR